jgi:hypothetical protein
MWQEQRQEVELPGGMRLDKLEGHFCLLSLVVCLYL